MSKPSKPSPQKSQRESSVAKPISLSPLTFQEAVSDLLKVKPPQKIKPHPKQGAKRRKPKR